MGVRLNRFQAYFQQTGPLVVTGHIGQELASSFRMVVNNVRQLNEHEMVLSSGTGEMVIHEEEIYRIGVPDNSQVVSLLMDGGIELRFTPYVEQVAQPIQQWEENH